MAAIIVSTSLERVLGLRDAICQLLPGNSKIRGRLLECKTLESFVVIGEDVLEVASIDSRDARVWEFITQFALSLEAHSLPTCQKILSRALQAVVVERKVCLAGYLYVVSRYVNVCEPTSGTRADVDATLRCIGLLEDAHMQYMQEDTARMRDSVSCALADVTILKHLFLLHRATGHTTTAFGYAEEYMECSELILAQCPATSEFAIEIRMSSTAALLLMIYAYKDEKQHGKALRVADRLVDTWASLHTARPSADTLNGHQHAWTLKARVLLAAGQVKQATTILHQQSPLDALPEFRKSDCPASRKSLEDWVEVMEECCKALQGISGYDCANCQQPAAQRCSGCLAVLYCSKACQKSHRREHSSACVMSPAQKFTKVFIDTIDAMYSLGWHNDKYVKLLENADNLDHMVLMGGFSTVSVTSGGMMPRLIRCADSLLRYHHVHSADPLVNIAHAAYGECATILPAYVSVLKSDWKRVVIFCSKYAEEKKRTSVHLLFEAVALFNLGYVQKAQNGINQIYLLVHDQLSLRKSLDIDNANKLHDMFSQMLALTAEGDSLFPSKGDRTCFACNAKALDGAKLRCCDTCRTAWYCSQKCQTDDWDFHRLLCSQFVSLKDNPDIAFFSSKDSAWRGARKMFPAGKGRAPDEARPGVKARENARDPASKSAETSSRSSRGAVHVCSGPGCEATSEGHELKKCEQCRAVWYCGRECQTKHWKKGHKLVCQPKGAALNLPTSVVFQQAKAAMGSSQPGHD